jgi:transposase
MSQRIVAKSTKNIGAITLLKPIMDALHIRETVDRYCPMERKRGLTQGQAIEALIINRLISPTPLYYVERWAKLYALNEICGIDANQVNDDRLARALDAYFPHIADIEADVAINAMAKYGLEPEVVHMDTTSLYFEGEYEESDMLRLGYSRDQKPDKKQVNLCLNVSAKEGIPFMHGAYPGNKPDPKIVLDNIKRLKAKLKPNHFIMVGDRSTITTDTVSLLLDSSMDFLGALKMTQPIQDLVASIDDIEFKAVEYEGATEAKYRSCERHVNLKKEGRVVRGVVVWSLKKAQEDSKRREVALKKVLSDFEKVRAKLNMGRLKRRDYVEKKVKEASEGKFGKLVKVEVGGLDGCVSLRFWRDEEALRRLGRLDGKHVLVTSVDWSASKVIETYRGRYVVESRISNMKSRLAVRPVFLHGDERVLALVAMTVLSLLVYSVLEVLARRSGLGKVTSRMLFWEFQKIILIKLVLGSGGPMNVVEDVTKFQAEILARLGFPLPEAFINV